MQYHILGDPLDIVEIDWPLKMRVASRLSPSLVVLDPKIRGSWESLYLLVCKLECNLVTY